jgi:hypothetical protein
MYRDMEKGNFDGYLLKELLSYENRHHHHNQLINAPTAGA